MFCFRTRCCLERSCVTYQGKQSFTSPGWNLYHMFLLSARKHAHFLVLDPPTCKSQDYSTGLDRVDKKERKRKRMHGKGNTKAQAG